MTSFLKRSGLIAAIVLATACPGQRETQPVATTSSTATTATTTPPAATSTTTEQHSSQEAAPQSPAGGQVTIGSTMPAFSATYLDGKPFDLAGERGNVVFLNLWATWCGPCRFEIPELELLHQKQAAAGLRVIGVSLDEGNPGAVKEFVEKHKMTYPIVLDPTGRSATILEASVIPTSVVIDRMGKVVWRKYGVVSTADASLNGAIEKALAAR
jgi:thiol-disulfide isomerase/thioredoxin